MLTAPPVRHIRASAAFSAILAILAGTLLYPFAEGRIPLAIYLAGCATFAIALFIMMMLEAALSNDEDRNARPAADPRKGLRIFVLVTGVVFALVYTGVIFRLGPSAAIPTLAIYAAGYATILGIAFIFRRRQ